MHIHIEQISENGLPLQFEETPEAFPVLAEMVDKGACEFRAPISVTLRALRFGDMVEVDGDINTSVRLSCGRCLQKFEASLNSRFSLTYRLRESDTKEAESRQEELELKAEDMGLIYYQGEEIDLTNEIQEQVVMAFPLRALCQPDCKGLCPDCGSDLNDGKCGCDKKALTGKFAALKNFTLTTK
jgi:uncharacterized protein